MYSVLVYFLALGSTVHNKDYSVPVNSYMHTVRTGSLVKSVHFSEGWGGVMLTDRLF